MEIPNLDGTTFHGRVDLVFQLAPKSPIEAAELLNHLIRHERKAGEFGVNLESAANLGADTERWLTTLIATAVFLSAYRRGGQAITVGVVFFDELRHRYPEVLRPSFDLSTPPDATLEQKQQIIADIWSAQWPLFFETALHREVLDTVIRFPILSPGEGVLKSALSA